MPKVVEAILSMPAESHVAVRRTCILLLGELCEWVERHPACLLPCLQALLHALHHPGLAPAAAHALQVHAALPLPCPSPALRAASHVPVCVCSASARRAARRRPRTWTRWWRRRARQTRARSLWVTRRAPRCCARWRRRWARCPRRSWRPRCATRRRRSCGNCARYWRPTGRCGRARARTPCCGWIGWRRCSATWTCRPPPSPRRTRTPACPRSRTPGPSSTTS